MARASHDTIHSVLTEHAHTLTLAYDMRITLVPAVRIEDEVELIRIETKRYYTRHMHTAL